MVVGTYTVFEASGKSATLDITGTERERAGT